jgi:NADH-quinone oxidoreductase B subunit
MIQLLAILLVALCIELVVSSFVEDNGVGHEKANKGSNGERRNSNSRRGSIVKRRASQTNHVEVELFTGSQSRRHHSFDREDVLRKVAKVRARRALSADAAEVEDLSVGTEKNKVLVLAEMNRARSSPRQADLLIVAGTVTMKMAPALVRLYEQMPEPKYVIAMGACTITGGMFSADSTTAVRGVDKLIPVDLYLPGCPPRPEAIFDAVIKLRKKVGDESLAEKNDKFWQNHCSSGPYQ